MPRRHPISTKKISGEREQIRLDPVRSRPDLANEPAVIQDFARIWPTPYGTLPAIAGGLCFAHAPERAASRSNGGRVTRRSARAARWVPERLAGIADLLEQAIGEAYRGELDARVLSAMAAATSALVRIHQGGEVDARLRTVERTLTEEAAERRRWGA